MQTPATAESIFDAALDKVDPVERAAFLDEACKGNDELRRRVERLLEAHAKAGAFLERPIAHLPDVPSKDRTSADSDAKVQAPLDETQAEEGAQVPVDDQLTFLAPAQKPGSLGRLDHYEILEVVGKGGFGTVLRAFDEKLHRVVAIKILSPELAASGTARQRFIREARTAAAVTHEHVVTIHAVVEEHRPPYLVMQMIDGVTLQQKLDKTGTLSVREILRIGMQMAEGLAAAHKQGLVHRDIKPANILLENGIERVKITDFGLARAVDDASVTQSGVVAGTPMYMSPEQAEGLAIDHRSDLFSLGTVLYAMCTGHPPFRATGTVAVLKRVVEHTPRPIREINHDIPEWLCDIVAKLHAKKPEDRYQKAKEVAEVLGQRLADVQAGRPIERTGGVADGSARANAASSVSTGTGVATPGATSPGWSVFTWLSMLTLGVLGAMCSFAGTTAMSRGGLTAQGRVLGPIFFVGGPALFAWMIFVGARKSWLRWLTGAAGTLLAIGAVIAPLIYNQLNPPPLPRAFLEVSTNAKNVHVEVIPLDDPDNKQVFPPQDFMGQLLDKSVAPGNWKVIATRGGKVHYQIEFTFVAGDRKRVIIPEQSDTAPATEPGWVSLFDGKDLLNWYPQDDKWSVKDSLLTGTHTGRLHAKQKYGDFHLRATLRYNGETNASISFRGQPGIHAEMRIGTVANGSISLYAGNKNTEVVRAKEGLLRPNAWQEFDLIARGKRVTVKMDGQPCAEATIAEMPDAGIIRLNAYAEGTVVEFKKIEIKELPPEESKSYALSFDGVDDHVVLNNLRYSGGHPITLEAWVRVPSAPGRQMTIIGNSTGLAIGVHKDGRWYGGVRDMADPVTPAHSYCFSDQPCEPGKWTHLAMVLSGRTATLHVNGRAQKVQAKLRADRVPTTSLFFIGARQVPKSEAHYPFLGDVAALRISKIARYDRDFTPDKTFKPDSDTIALYDFKHGPSSVLQDSSGLERHGNIVGARWINIDDNRPPAGIWASYFNGKDLRGWREHAPGKGDWTVRDGLLIGHNYLYSQRLDWGRFHLKMEAKLNGSGEIRYHIHHNDWKGGIQLIPYGKPDSVGGQIRSNIDPNWHPSIKEVVFPKDDWFTLEVISDGPRFLTKTNGIVTADFTLTAEQQKKWYKQGMISIGTGSKGEWTIRRIEIKELPPEPGWVPLFNGKNLNGLDQIPPASWTIEQGELVNQGKAHLYSLKKDYRDVHCRVEFNADAGAYGMIAVRRKGAAELVGVTLGTYAVKRKDGSIFQNDDQGKSTVHVYSPLDLKPNTLAVADVIIRGDEMTVAIDGKEVARHTFTNAPGDGAIGVGASNGTIRFRKIEIKELPPEPGWVQLFNRKDTSGWKYHPKHPGEWTVKDGILTSGGKGGNYLYTERDDYADFHLRAEVQLEKGFSSAINFRTGFGSTWEDNKMQPGLDGPYTLIARPFDEKPTGSLRVTGLPFSVAEKGLVDAKDWFVLEIIAKGNRIESLVNGKPAASLFDKRKKGRFEKGHIALQMLNSDIVVRYRKIEIKELPASP